MVEGDVESYGICKRNGLGKLRQGHVLGNDTFKLHFVANRGFRPWMKTKV